MAQLALFSGLYGLSGCLLWEVMISHSEHDPSDPLVRCERLGAVSKAEDAAFATAKGAFLLLWPPCLLFYAAAQALLRARAN